MNRTDGREYEAVDALAVKRDSMKVEIWSDVVCPWCHIGKRRQWASKSPLVRIALAL